MNVKKKQRVSASSDNVFNDSRFRIAVIGALFVTGLLVLWGRLYYIQVMGGEKHLEQVSNQSMRRIRIPNRRGRIVSSDNVVFADNRLEFDLVFYPEEMKKRRRQDTVLCMYENARRAAAMTGRENTVTTNEIIQHLYKRPGIPLVVLKNLDTKAAARAFEFARITPGCDVVPRLVRTYPMKRTACHIIG